MRTLRLTQATGSTGRHQVEIALEGHGARRATTAEVGFDLSLRDQERLRWYFEDYPQYPLDPAPEIAARIEQQLAELGQALFRAVFEGSRDATRLWDRIEPHLADTRIEVASTVEGATAIPWELLRDPITNTPVALRAGAFVRAHLGPARLLEPPATAPDSLRILLVICRPRGEHDVPFRSVASQLVRLSADVRATLQLDVLRPPTFVRLAQVLRDAKAQAVPYQVVHFDGHGTWADLSKVAGRGELSPLHYGDRRSGAHGYLLFEQPEDPDNVEFIDGPRLGDLLVETDVPVLVLNACRSAHAELTTRPDDATELGTTTKATATAGKAQSPVHGTAGSIADAHGRVRAYGSLAQEVIDAGVAGVVAMRYVVYVATAAQFVGELYAGLLAGQELGVAVSRGRKHLADRPIRQVGLKPVNLQDWPVPVIYQAGPVTLVPPAVEGQRQIVLDVEAAGRERQRLELGMPAGSDVGFFGRDETLLALDRAFDTQQVVLLHAWAGAGKTTTAVEFARWYQFTGGLTFPGGDGRLLFTSFQQHTPLAQVLDEVGQAFAGDLEAAGMRWLVLDDAQRRRLALQVLGQVPVLWVWDNVEPVAGFPTGVSSAWTDAEQAELREFLRELQHTKAKVLLTSRRDERAWLGDLPRRVELPPMPMADRVQLVRAVADRHGQRLTDVGDLRPLLAFSQGNPLTLTVLVGQALREGIRSKEQMEEFVERLRAGEAEIADEERLGRSASLAASLGYGFAQAFSEQERAQLALLGLFQGFVDVAAFRLLGDPEQVDEPVPQVRNLSEEVGIGLLDRAAEIGLLTAYGGGFYRIHPALPWYFQRLFTATYGPPDSQPTRRAIYAYTNALGLVGDSLFNSYHQGHIDVIRQLAAEEANLLHARRLARTYGWWDQIIGPMQGLRVLYQHTARTAEWARLVDELIPDLADPANDGPRPGREQQWRPLTEYRARLALEARDFSAAERLQQALVKDARTRAASALATALEALTTEQRFLQIRSLAVAIEGLGHIQREQGQPGCVASYQEALELYQRSGDRQGQAIVANNLAQVYMEIPALRDLEAAETWARESLNLFNENDSLSRSKCFHLLAGIAYERFQHAREAGAAEDAGLRAYLTAARHAAHQALSLTPPEAVSNLANRHNLLGNIYSEYADRRALQAAMDHFQEALRIYETTGDRYLAAGVRFNLAVILSRHPGRLDEARLWAQAALRDFASFGHQATDRTEQARRLLDGIKADMKQDAEEE